MDAIDYKVRCDKCQLKPDVYCEMCMIRTKLQDAIETNRKETQRTCASIRLSLKEVHNILHMHKTQILRIIEVFSLEKAMVQACDYNIPFNSIVGEKNE